MYLANKLKKASNQEEDVISDLHTVHEDSEIDENEESTINTKENY